jgi:hypothetical protein
MSNIIIGALAAAPVAFLAWITYNWIGKPVLDVRSARIDALKEAEFYGFVGYGYEEDEINTARSALSNAAMSLRALSRGQPWTARFYCHVLHCDFELSASVLLGLVGLSGAHLSHDNTSRRDAVDAVHVLLNASQHMTAERIKVVREKINTALALPRD